MLPPLLTSSPSYSFDCNGSGLNPRTTKHTKKRAASGADFLYSIPNSLVDQFTRSTYLII